MEIGASNPFTFRSSEPADGSIESTDSNLPPQPIPTTPTHSNQKLTKVIAGRTISGTSQADSLLTLTFDDGSTMQIKVAPSNTNSAATGGKILKVRQGSTELDLDLDGSTTITITTAEETSSVML